MEPKRKALKKLNLSELREACTEGNRDAVKELLANGQIKRLKSPSKRPSRPFSIHAAENDELTLPIHTSCKSNVQCGEVIHALLTSGSFSAEDLTSDGDTALHVACANKNLEAVQALLRYSQQKSILNCLQTQNRDGNTPFHLACKVGSIDKCTSLLQLLQWLENCGLAGARNILGKKNKLNQTCLGIAIDSEDWPTAQLVLHYTHANPVTVYSDLKRVIFENYPSDVKLEFFEFEPIDVFVLGDPGSGKTTLINTLAQAIQSTSLASWISSFGSVRTNVELSRVGIVPMIAEFQKQTNRDHKCHIAFHDVNSYHGYSHEAIFKCCSREPLDALYILCVDTTKNCESSLLYWLNFLCKKLSEYSVALPPEKKYQKVRFAVVGTFADSTSLSLPHPPELDINNFVTKGRDSDRFTSRLSWCGNFCINSKKTSSCQPLLSLFNTLCEHLHCNSGMDATDRYITAQTHILAHLLSTYPKNDVLPLQHVRALVYNSASALCSLLPKQKQGLDAIYFNLRHFSPFKTFTFTRTKTHNYIVLDYGHFVKTIEKGLTKLKSCARHGVVSRQDIKNCFEDCSHQFIIYYLEHFNLCEKISKNGLDHMRSSIRSSSRSRRTINLSQTSRGSRKSMRQPSLKHKRSKSESDTLSTIDITESDRMSRLRYEKAKSNEETQSVLAVNTEDESSLKPKASSQVKLSPSPRHSTRAEVHQQDVPYYFIPSLIHQNAPSELWDRNNDEYGYGFAWCLLPQEGDTWFLSYKFSTVVLFRLLFSFAPHPSTHSDFSMERTCDLWDEGILWCDPVGARVCVAIRDRNKVILSMQCLKETEINCLSIRNEIIKDIKDQLHEMHPEITPRELVLPFDGNQYIFPIFDIEMSYVAFDKENIKKAIFEESSVVSTSGKHNRRVESLLHFEPLCFLNADMLCQLFDTENANTEISEDFFMTLAKALSSKWIHLAKHWEAIVQKYYIDSLLTNSIGSPHDTAFEMFLHLRDIEYREPNYRIDVYGGLLKSLFEISIFSPADIQNMLP